MLAENRVRDLRHDGVFVAEDAVEERAAIGEPFEEVGAHLVFHGPAHTIRGGEGRALEGAKCLGEGMRYCSWCARNGL